MTRSRDSERVREFDRKHESDLTRIELVDCEQQTRHERSSMSIDDDLASQRPHKSRRRDPDATVTPGRETVTFS
jgi:hypothetical protein